MEPGDTGVGVNVDVADLLTERQVHLKARSVAGVVGSPRWQDEAEPRRERRTAAAFGERLKAVVEQDASEVRAAVAAVKRDGTTTGASCRAPAIPE